MNENKKIDRRVRYTKKAIRDSFLALLDEKPIEKISVTEICKGADINRGTFYSHYTDPFDLRRSIANEIVELMENRMAELGVKRLTSLQSFKLLKEYRELFRIFVGPNGDKDTMLEIISSQTDDFLADSFKMVETLPKQQCEYLRMMLVSSIASTIKLWYDSGFETEPEVVAEMLDTYCKRGVFGFANPI